jgi:hypothetical protein
MMLKELENLLAEIARQQGIELPPNQRPQAPRNAPVRQHPELVDAEIIEAEPVRLDDRSRIAPTIHSGVDDQLAQRDIQAYEKEERADVGIHERFDQQLSQIGDFAYDETSDMKSQASASSTSWIAQMFRDASNARQAILVKEILTRPVDRW